MRTKAIASRVPAGADRKAVANQIVSLLVSAAVLAAGAFIFWTLVHKPEREADASPSPEPPTVRTVSIREHQGDLDMDIDGIVAPFREIEVASEVAGKVVYKNDACNGGRFVTKGTPLIRIDPQDYKLAQQRLRSQLDQAHANLSELEVEIKNTEELIELAEEQLDIEDKEVERFAGLIQERIVTDSAMDKARQAQLTARNALVQLRSQMQLLTPRKKGLESARALTETDLEKANLDIERTEIVAAVDGVVVADFVEQDSYVQKGTPLFKLEDTSAVEVKCRLRMEELHWLWRQSRAGEGNQAAADDYQIPQTPVTVTYQLSGRDTVQYQWRGILSRYDGSGIDEITRTVACRVVVPQPREVRVVPEPTDSEGSGAPPALVRGMFVSVRLHIKQPDCLALVPEQAVQPGKALWLVRDGRLALVKPITLIELVEKRNEAGLVEAYWLIEANGPELSIRDRVVVPPFAMLTEGMLVTEGPAP